MTVAVFVATSRHSMMNRWDYVMPSILIWAAVVAQACQHGNKTIQLTALSVLSEIKQDTFKRHRHSRIALIEARLSSPQSPRIWPCGSRLLCRVRNPNCYVRSFIQGVKDTYVGASVKNDNRLRWPSVLIENLSTSDRDNVEPQLQVLPEPLGQQILDEVADRVGIGEINNVIAYLLGTLKRARNGQFNSTVGAVQRVQQPKAQPVGGESRFMSKCKGKAKEHRRKALLG